MERLLTFRLEASKLNENEFNVLMKQLIESYTKEQIISCIFNHFYYQYLSHKQMDKLQNITESIANIIHLREENEQNDDDNESEQESKDETNETITLDLLPQDTISQCASYLSFDDYKQFEQCNRIIYCSTNSPSTLYHLDMNHIIHSHWRDATRKKIIRSVINNQSRFVFIKSLDLTKSGFHNHIKQFNRLERLCIDSKFAMDGMNLNIFKPIKVLQIIKKPDYNRFNRSSNVFHLHRLYNFLKQFPNLENLSIRADTRDDSQVTIYQNKNQIPNTLLPKLKILLLINPCTQDRNHYYISDHKHGCGFKHTFRDKMIKIYGKQMLSLTCGGHDILDLSDLNKLKELMVINPNLNDLSNIITKLPHLQRFKIDGLPPSNDDIVVKNMVASIIKCSSLEYIAFDVCYQQFVKLAQYLKKGFDTCTTQMQRKLKISFSTHYLIGMDASTQIPQKISIRPKISINDSIEGLVDALQLSSINDFMVKFRYQIEDVHHDRYPEINDETKKQMINKLKQRYLVVEEVGVHIKNRKFMKIIISNRNCKINGYTEQWLNKLAMF